MCINDIYSLIHSGHFYSALLRSAPDYSMDRSTCIGVSRRSAQVTASKGLAQGSYVAARAGVEPTTLRLRIIELTKAPPRPTPKDASDISDKLSFQYSTF